MWDVHRGFSQVAMRARGCDPGHLPADVPDDKYSAPPTSGTELHVGSPDRRRKRVTKVAWQTRFLRDFGA
jgi:hypothetical protein